MDNLNQYVEGCVEEMLKRYPDDNLQRRLFFALGYMKNSNEVEKLLWAIVNGEKLTDE